MIYINDLTQEGKTCHAMESISFADPMKSAVWLLGVVDVSVHHLKWSQSHGNLTHVVSAKISMPAHLLYQLQLGTITNVNEFPGQQVRSPNHKGNIDAISAFSWDLLSKGVGGT